MCRYIFEMSAKKYDWPSLKEEFIASRYLDALSWARNTTSPLPVLHGANFKLHTKGWRDDKQSFLEKRSEQYGVFAQQERQFEIGKLMAGLAEADNYIAILEARKLELAA